MIFNIYCNYNKKVECYERPLVLQDSDEEYIERIKRDFKASGDGSKSPTEAQIKMAEYVIYKVGTYDDVNGLIKLEEKNAIFDVGCLLQVGKNDASC